MYEREFVSVRERRKRELLECSGVDEVLEKKRKKKSEDRDKGEDKQVGGMLRQNGLGICVYRFKFSHNFFSLEPSILCLVVLDERK